MKSRSTRTTFEVGRATEPAETVVSDLVGRVGLRMSDAPFSRVVEQALRQSWTRDPFDRLIVANAIVDNALLLTFDDILCAYCNLAFWS